MGNEKRRKRNAELLKQDVAKQLEDVCLHCAFFKMHQDKWAGWKPGHEDDGKAFNDLVRSAIKIVAEVFSMLDDEDKAKFLMRVRQTQQDEDVGKSLKEVVEAFRDALGVRKPSDPTKH